MTSDKSFGVLEPQLAHPHSEDNMLYLPTEWLGITRVRTVKNGYESPDAAPAPPDGTLMYTPSASGQTEPSALAAIPPPTFRVNLGQGLPLCSSMSSFPQKIVIIQIAAIAKFCITNK